MHYKKIKPSKYSGGPEKKRIIKLTQYAGDTMALVLDSVLHLPKLLNNLKNIRALEVNKRKTA